jgi:hypothetical protein
MKHQMGKLKDSGWELLERYDGMQWWLDESGDLS